MNTLEICIALNNEDEAVNFYKKGMERFPDNELKIKYANMETK